jgi:DNA-binding LytR/AlgR family response regulator
MIDYLIIDDEYMAHDIIKGYCDMLPNLNHAKSCYDAIEALAFLRNQKVDLIFLDLNMPKLKGFEFLRTLTSPPKVIVTTGYKEYAIEGYELNIIDYLLKPFSFQRFLKAVNKATIESSDTDKSDLHLPVALDQKQTVFIRDNKRHVQVEVASILHLESAGNYVKIIMKEKTVTVRSKLTDLLQKLPIEQFIRVHKSFAVARQHIKSIEGNRIHIGDAEVPIGKVYKMNLNSLFQ